MQESSPPVLNNYPTINPGVRMKLTVLLDGEKQVEIGELDFEKWKEAGIKAGWYDNENSITQADIAYIPDLFLPTDLPEGEYTLILRGGE